MPESRFTKIRFMPKGFVSPSHVYVYGDKTAITLWSKESPSGILIKNQEIADKFRAFFEWFWKFSE